MHNLYHANTLDILPSLSDLGIDLVATDPPYGTGGWRRDARGQGSNPAGTLVQETWDDGALEWLALVPPSVRAVATFWSAAYTARLLVAAEAVGLTKHRCLYMRKPDPKPMPGGRIRWSVEPIWVLSRGGVIMVGGDDMFEATTPREGRDAEATGHPYQKPLRVMRWLLAKFPWATTVLDPFMGSGTTGVAAVEAGLDFIGIEQAARWYGVAAELLAAVQAQGRLF